MRILKISNRYEKMDPEQLENALRGFCGLDDRVLEVVWKASQILLKNYLMIKEIPGELCKDVFIHD